MGAQAQVGGAQTLVECQGALLLPDLHQAVGEAPIQLALGTDMGWASHVGPWLAQQALFVCKGLWGTSEKALPPARKMTLQAAKLQKGSLPLGSHSPMPGAQPGWWRTGGFPP